MLSNPFVILIFTLNAIILNKNLLNKNRLIIVLIIQLVFSACATHRLHMKENIQISKSNKKSSHTFYLVGGYGNQKDSTNDVLLKKLENELNTASENSTLLYLGDNISDKKNNWQQDKNLINQQLELAKRFKGVIRFLPGSNAWKTKHVDSIQRVEEYLDDFEENHDFVLPNNGCSLDFLSINENLDLLLLDSKWFLSDWNKVEGINKKCTDIVTRQRFAQELEGYINDAQGKNLVIAMHHPIFSNGTYAGHSSFKDHILPFPVLGTVLTGFEDLAATSPDKAWSRNYLPLRILVSALAKKSDRITVVSAHEESLQYLAGGSIHQVVSGSFGSTAVTNRSKSNIITIGGTLPFEGQFTYGKNGFAKLVYFEDGSSEISFITAKENPYNFKVLEEFPERLKPKTFKHVQDKTVKDSVYALDKKINRSGFYKFLWGERYRKYYYQPVTAKTVYLDTLFGGLKITKKGGGHQSYSIRLEDENKGEYAMRSLRKDPLKFLKFRVPGVAYIEDDYKNTLPVELISDFFTTAHPYIQLVIPPLAQAVNVNHGKNALYFVPKQNTLGKYNSEFGNELYFIEPRPSDEQADYKGYRRTIDKKGEIKDFESTTDMLEKIKSDESYTIDKKAYVRARVFDVLIGDWDRHQDQWRWAEYEIPNGNKIFMPIPRDRDNAFPKFDGKAIDIAQWFIPITRQWQSFGPEIYDLKWFNYAGSKLDRVLLSQIDAEVWEDEANYIKSNLSSTTINEAFLRLPAEVQDSTANYIKQSIKARLQELPKYAKTYGDFLEKRVVIHATEKDDHIKIIHELGNKTTVVLRRLLSDEKNEKFYERTFDTSKTDELWIYGLGDDDIFEVKGKNESTIFIRLIGGYGKDEFKIENKKHLKIYDWKHEDIIIEGENPQKRLTNTYNTNTFHWKFFEPNENILTPSLDFRTDDGLSIGAKNTFINNGFNGNPFRQKHTLQAKYFFTFEATELDYRGIYANIIQGWNFETNAYFSSQRYAQNFFGFGNNTNNQEDALGINFYRARTQQIKLDVGIAYQTLRFKALFESFRVEEMDERFFNASNFSTPIFERQNYVGAETSVHYYNDDADDFPTKGLFFGFTGGFKSNMQLSDNTFGYLALRAEIVQKLIPSGNLVISTNAEYKTNLGNDYFFYHAANIGGNNGLRGFRDERFSGKSYFYQSSDLRLRLKRYITAVSPITVGVYGGFDYGRVWQPNKTSNQWHTSQGFGLWASTANFLAINLGLFNSVEGNFVQFGFGFGF